MYKANQSDMADQSGLIRALLDSMRNKVGPEAVLLVETHISWVLLTEHYAYKIKKAVKLGFLDFSTLDARHYYCDEEIRLNRRLAPNIYLDVIPIGGSAEAPVLGALPALEYAVRMRRFDTSRQLDRLAASNKISAQHIASLASTIAGFHSSLPGADMHSTFGTAEVVRRDAEQNFEQLQALLKDQPDLDSLAAIRHASESEYIACRSLFEQRVAQGFVRECHGDLHLGNIVLIDDQPVPFDGIEFNPELRWIDVMSEVAFTVMDLLYHQRAEFAYRFLNAYLEETGDYAGIALLRFYMAYRAMVRAKVGAIRAAQTAQSPGVSAEAWASCRGYLELAASCQVRKQSVLIITYGLPGSGKTTFAQIALERLQAIRLRSDVERKRLFGLSPLADSSSSTNIDLYSAEVTHRTYSRLLALTRMLLETGHTVIVDAAFIEQTEREPFRLLAEELKLAFAIASIQASTETLRARITQRLQAANDASEADIAVLEKLLPVQQPLSQLEQVYKVEFNNEGAGVATDSAAWTRLDQLLNRGSCK